MAKKRKSQDAGGEMEIDLTPMIDIVFQLIIFFMIVSDMTTADLVELALPEARQATKPDGEDSKKYVVINLQQKGKILIRGKVYKPDKIQERLEIEAEEAGWEENPEAPDVRLSKLKVLIRADRDVEYGKVQDILEACGKAKIYKVAIGATNPPNP